ncbi:uncharacterized RNA-binding protein C660.15-like isoform X3 [Orbicella faveolata]|uniref:uncharacterized RNA-binding protein C660.15-like isoform X3 n=1 Tax=Orbicella faveolata TaxID=48498 RepID=UPI0009E30AD5|nr:uncharacterized RNA-binding protein C660.15-like isoform X3 [Orbicella faveolata]
MTEEKAESSPVKDKENEEADASLDDTHHHGNPLFQSSPAEAPWKTVEKKSQETKARNFDSRKDGSWRGGRSSRPGRSRGRGQGRGPSPNPPFSQGRGPEKSPYVEGPGRTGRGQRGRGSDNRPGWRRGRGATNNRSDHGYILKNVLYERNKLYVLGLRSKTTKDCVLNFIARISGCDVKRVLMFKSGRAIVTLDTDKITNSDFAMICEEAAKPKNQLEKVNVLIERAPVCKSIFVRGIPENTPQEEFENYFDKFGVVEKFITNEEEVKARRVNEKRAIVYFKTDKST